MPTHGSLSKAGRVRFLFQADVSRRYELKRRAGLVTKSGNPIKHNKRHKCPRIRNRIKFKRYLSTRKNSDFGWF